MHAADGSLLMLGIRRSDSLVPALSINVTAIKPKKDRPIAIDRGPTVVHKSIWSAHPDVRTELQRQNPSETNKMPINSVHTAA